MKIGNLIANITSRPTSQNQAAKKSVLLNQHWVNGKMIKYRRD